MIQASTFCIGDSAAAPRTGPGLSLSLGLSLGAGAELGATLPVPVAFASALQSALAGAGAPGPAPVPALASDAAAVEPGQSGAGQCPSPDSVPVTPAPVAPVSAVQVAAEAEGVDGAEAEVLAKTVPPAAAMDAALDAPPGDVPAAAGAEDQDRVDRPADLALQPAMDRQGQVAPVAAAPVMTAPLGALPGGVDQDMTGAAPGSDAVTGATPAGMDAAQPARALLSARVAGVERDAPARSDTAEGGGTAAKAISAPSGDAGPAGAAPAASAAQPPAPHAAGLVQGSAPAPLPAASPAPALSAPAPLVMTQGDWPATLTRASIAALTPEGGTMILELTPEDLGRLRVTLTLEGDMAAVRFQTDTPEAARLLSEAERQLSQEFARSGITLSGHEARSDTAAGGRGTPAPQRAAPDPDASAGAGAHATTLPLPAAGVINLIA